jgi:hypothetical protein
VAGLVELRQDDLADEGGAINLAPAVAQFYIQLGAVRVDQGQADQPVVGREVGEFGVEEQGSHQRISW